MKNGLFSLTLVVMLTACASDSLDPDTEAPDPDTEAPSDTHELDASEGDVDISPALTSLPGVQVVMRLDGDFDTASEFFDHPWPSDLRRTPSGAPAMTGLPNPEGVELIDTVMPLVAQRPGFPTIPVAWFRFDGAVLAQPGTTVTPASAESPVQLIDVDPNSPDRGVRYPTLLRTLESDIYVPEHVLAIAPWPGVVLPTGRRYAFVVMRHHGDAEGAPLGVPLALRQLAHGQTPEGDLGSAALEMTTPLWDTLGVARDDVAAATVFTVGDVVDELFTLSEAVRDTQTLAIDGLSVMADGGADHPRYCALEATVTAPAFQAGTPPFDTQGTFVLDADGVPLPQGEESFPLVVTLPKGPMPAGGFPLVLYFHGSGGVSTQVIDRGTVTVLGGDPIPGEGPAHVLAAHGFATASSALPVNPERVDGASDFEYLNFANLAAFRDTFRQGVIEQRLLLDALLDLTISDEVVAACDGLSLPDGETTYRMAGAPVFAMGQSMGGMYTNMVGAVEPRLTALAPTGAGGFWSWFILETELLNAPPLLALLLGTNVELTFLHPVLHLLQTAWEPTEPLVYMPRLSRRPLSGHPARDVYEPIGLDDSYFPSQLLDAVALAYGHEQAGEAIWPSLQASLALGARDGLVTYPVSENLTSTEGAPYTGVVVQYLGDGLYDPHAIFAQLDAVKYQYGCFFETALSPGGAVVPAPATLGTPCPTVAP